MVMVLHILKKYITKFLASVDAEYKIKKIFKDVSMGIGAEFRLPQYVHVGKSVSLGDRVKLMCWDKYNGEVLTKKPQITIGNNFRATRDLTIQCAGSVEIGDDVLVASNVLMIDYNHGMDADKKNYLEQPLEIGSIKVGNGVWIGNSVIVLKDVTIGEKAVIGAGSVVTKDIPPYSMAVGNPAKVIKQWNFQTGRWEKMC